METEPTATRLGLPAVLFAALLLAGIGQLIYVYPRLPQTMASHFGAGGQADGWSSKQSFAWFTTGIYAFTGVVFGVLSLLLPRMPVSMINLPHREYWLAPERRQATFAYLSTWILWFGTATLGLLLIVISMSLRANIAGTHRLPGWSWGIIVAYLAFTAVRIVMMIVRFYRVPEH